MNGAHGYQFTPFGILRGDQPVPAADATVAPAAVPMSAPVTFDVALPAANARPQLKAGAAAPSPVDRPITGKQIVQQCKARIRELEKALRAVPEMQQELESLRRLIEAAQRPSARVVKLAERTAGHSR